MKYAYPQDPTHAVSAMRRYDESTDAATQQSNLERKQDIATVGETVPLVFCDRSDFGNDQGVSGGVWVSPRLIQLGIKETDLSMMYLLSQGNVAGLQKSNTHWGYSKLEERDADAQFCSAYEAVPSCLDLDYEPGGSLSWTTTVTAGGPNGVGQYVTPDKTQKIVINWTSTISVTGSGTIVGGWGGKLGINQSIDYNPLTCNVTSRAWPWNKQSGYWVPTSSFNPSSKNIHESGLHSSESCATTSRCNFRLCFRTYDMSKHHLQTSWTQTSEVRVDYEVIRTSDDVVVKSGTQWIKDGASSLTITGLDPDTYRVVFSNLYKERNKPYTTATIPNPNTSLSEFWASYTASYPTSGPPSEFARHTNPGSETQSITSSITCTVYNQLDFPELPGGEEQIVGGLSDLTMTGIRGDILKLRPQDGPDYFIQSHVFVEQGAQVSRLLEGGTGASKYYPDLVNHLMRSSKVLRDEQIDIDSLLTSSKMNEQYSLFFNGILQTTNSLAEWMTRTAPYFLLTPRQVDGKYGLWPVVPLDGDYKLKQTATTPDLVITEDDIIQDSYKRRYISAKDRKPVCLVMVYRDQPTGSPGQTVTVEVRYPGTALSGPFEQHDMVEFCCKAEHAVYAARYILAKRRYVTHNCSLTLNRAGKQVKPGDIVRIDLGGNTTDGEGISDSTFYQVESVSEGQQGLVRLDMTHFPVDSNGVSVVAKETHAGAVSIQ